MDHWLIGAHGSGFEDLDGTHHQVFVGVLALGKKKKTMSGIDDLMAESNDRWAPAIRRAQGIEDNGLGGGREDLFHALLSVGTVPGGGWDSGRNLRSAWYAVGLADISVVRVPRCGAGCRGWWSGL